MDDKCTLVTIFSEPHEECDGQVITDLSYERASLLKEELEQKRRIKEVLILKQYK